MKSPRQIKQEVNQQLLAVLEVLKSGYWYDRKVSQTLKPFEISHEQFNVLRILEYHFPRKFSLKEIQSRLMNKTANTTRLVEKLRRRELLKSEYSKTNRRMLQIELTDKGIQLMNQLNRPVLELGKGIENVLSDDDAAELIRILRKFRTL